MMIGTRVFDNNRLRFVHSENAADRLLTDTVIASISPVRRLS